MSYGHTQQAKGYSAYPDAGTVKISVRMPCGHFDHMKLKALKNGTSIAEVIRSYIEVGIEVDKDMELDEPQPAICTVDISRAPGLKMFLEKEQET